MWSGLDFIEEDGRKWFGKIVFLFDKERGGVIFKMFLNVIFGKCKKKKFKFYKFENISEVDICSLLYIWI